MLVFICIFIVFFLYKEKRTDAMYSDCVCASVGRVYDTDIVVNVGVVIMCACVCYLNAILLALATSQSHTTYVQLQCIT